VAVVILVGVHHRTYTYAWTIFTARCCAIVYMLSSCPSVCHNSEFYEDG